MPTENAKSRGYFKIKGAASAFNFDFRGKTVLDIGSSTGGFTEYALDHGAKRVIAVEKGTNQMKKPLRFDPRIDLHEKTDIFNVGVAGTSDSVFSSKEATRSSVLVVSPDIILADVSFISLTTILKHSKDYLSDSHTEFLVMLKPQFEANPDELHDGVVKNNKIRRDIIKRFEIWLKKNGFVILNKHDNELKGKTGNIERFYLLKTLAN